MATMAVEREASGGDPGYPERGYHDLHDHIQTLRNEGLLIQVDRVINKDTEMHPLVRWQFRGGIAPEDRRAFLFSNVVDGKGRKFDIPVLVCGLAGNNRIYSLGMGCAVEEVRDRWMTAMSHPIKPRLVDAAVCQEIVYTGDDLRRGHGLDAIPVPISSPGWDNAPYTSSSHFITADPDTGIQNMGNYRGMIKAPDRMGMNTSIELRTGGYMHWGKWKERGKPMPCAVVRGCPPAVSYTAVQKVPEIYDELDVTGGLIGRPLNVVKCKTVDLMVPAEAEVIIEGFVSTEFLEPEAPFGESHGHVNLQEYNGFMDVTCITRKHDAIFTSFVSQLAPSEATVMRQPGQEAIFLRHLRDHIGIKGILHVHMHMPLIGGYRVLVLRFARGTPQTEVWRALYASVTVQLPSGKFVIAVDEDIDPNNA